MSETIADFVLSSRPGHGLSFGAADAATYRIA